MDNKLTPNRNLLWESSRMILPEHKERILEHRQNLKRQNRPELDQQAVEEIERALQFSFHHGAEIGLTLYGEFENKIKRGVVRNIDPQLKRFLLDEVEWISWKDVIEVREPF